MSDRISRIVRNPKKAREITNRVLKDMDMRITKKFVPSQTSNYTIDMSPVTRTCLTISDDMFTSAFQHKTAQGGWRTVETRKIKGSLQRVENAFIAAVKRLADIKIK